MVFLELYAVYFMIGLFSIGGGLVSLPLLQDAAFQRGWLSALEFANMVAVSESTPGPIGVNMSTYTGFSQAGIPGALIATCGLVSPSLIVILLISRYYQHFKSQAIVVDLMKFLRPAATGLIVAAMFNIAAAGLVADVSIYKTGLDNLEWKAVGLLIFFVPAVLKIKLHPVLFIAIAAGLGVVLL